MSESDNDAIEKWFEDVFDNGYDRKGAVCLVEPESGEETWEVFNNTNRVHAEFTFANHDKLNRLLRERGRAAKSPGHPFRFYIFLTRLCSCRKKCGCHRVLRDWLADYLSIAEIHFVFGSLASLSKKSLDAQPPIWQAHMESLLNLLHFSELHPSIKVETLTKETYNMFVKANKWDESMCLSEEKAFFEKARKCMEGLATFSENFDFCEVYD